MQFALLLQSTLLVAMASVALGAVQIPQCASCAETETCPDSSAFLPVDPAIKAASPAKGWTKTYTSPKNKINVNFSDKKASEILIQHSADSLATAFIQFDKMMPNKDTGLTVSVLVPANADCVFKYPNGFGQQDVTDVKTYLIKSATNN